MHAFKMLNLVFTVISLLVHTFLNPAMAPKALAILLHNHCPMTVSYTEIFKFGYILKLVVSYLHLLLSRLTSKH